MYCPRCGSANPDEAKYCGNCGEDLSDVLKQPEEKSTNNAQKHTGDKSPLFNFFFSFGRKRKLIITFGVILLVMIPVLYFVSENGKTTHEYSTATPVNPEYSDYGTKLEFNNGELFYTANVDLQNAERLGNYLVKSGFYAGNVISGQFDKNSQAYVFRYVVKPGYENNVEYLKIVRQLANDISTNVFNGATVEINLTDSNFHTLKVINQNSNFNDEIVPTAEGNSESTKKIDNGNSNVDNAAPNKSDNSSNAENTPTNSPNNYDSNKPNTIVKDYGELVLNIKGTKLYADKTMEVTAANKIGEILDKAGFFDNTKKTIQLSMDGRIYVFKQIVPAGYERDRAVLRSAKSTAEILKKNVFSSRPFEVQLTDVNLKVIYTIKSGF